MNPEAIAKQLWAKYRSTQDVNAFPAMLHHNFIAAILEAMQLQQEADAKLCDELDREYYSDGHVQKSLAAEACAAAIRGAKP